MSDAKSAEPVIVGWRYRYIGERGFVGDWRYSDTEHGCNRSEDYEVEPLYAKSAEPVCDVDGNPCRASDACEGCPLPSAEPARVMSADEFENYVAPLNVTARYTCAPARMTVVPTEGIGILTNRLVLAVRGNTNGYVPYADVEAADATVCRYVDSLARENAELRAALQEVANCGVEQTTRDYVTVQIDHGTWTEVRTFAAAPARTEELSDDELAALVREAAVLTGDRTEIGNI